MSAVRIEDLAQAFVDEWVRPFKDLGYLCRFCRKGYAKTASATPHMEHCWVGRFHAALAKEAVS